jgi:hypothetical protein
MPSRPVGDGLDGDVRSGNQGGRAGAPTLSYKLEPVDVHAVFPGGPRPSTKVRAFVDFLVQELK